MAILGCEARWLFLVALLLVLVSADPPCYGPEDEQQYDRAKWGWYPEYHYKSSELVGPRILKRKWGPECDTGGYYLFAPRGRLWVGHPGPVLMDMNGQMVWHDPNFQHQMAYGFAVQRYKGKNYLTWWIGNDEVRGHGNGFYYMYDENYREFKKVKGLNMKMADLHEMIITQDNTVLMTLYRREPRDLRAQGGPEDGMVWECYFQEIDIETDTLLFEWKASDHFKFEDCFYPIHPVAGAPLGSKQNPWDWFHINSVEKDDKGNYLISSRYSHAASYIDGKTGKILWHLGGKHNNFTDLSKGTATNIKWQHHARWADDYTAITFFDNRAQEAIGKPSDSKPSRAIKVSIDTRQMTAKLDWEIVHPLGYKAVSQGSNQQLPNGNILVGYGSNPAITEFDTKGNIICDIAFGALHAGKNGSLSGGAVMSYRAFKQEWVGRPWYEPSVKFQGNQMYVSWNGATEVTKWILEGTNHPTPSKAQWAPIAEAPRAGFETDMKIGRGLRRYKAFKMTAMGKDGMTEGVWRVFPGAGGIVQPFEADKVITYSQSAGMTLIGALLAFGASFLMRRRNPTPGSRDDAAWESQDVAANGQPESQQPMQLMSMSGPTATKGVVGRAVSGAKGWFHRST